MQWGGVVLVAFLGVGLASQLIWRRAFRRSYTGRPDAAPLSPGELRQVQDWARRTVWLFVGTIATLLVWVVASVLTYPATTLVYEAGLVLVAVLGVGGIAHHFTGRCPRCGYIIALQTPLLLPPFCERCRTALR